MCTGQHSALQYSTVKHITVLHGVVHYGTLLAAVQYEYTAQCKWSAVQDLVYITVQYVYAVQYAMCPWYIHMVYMMDM